jgi:hypothetical protein
MCLLTITSNSSASQARRLQVRLKPIQAKVLGAEDYRTCQNSPELSDRDEERRGAQL